jgi:hypothetical protein
MGGPDILFAAAIVLSLWLPGWLLLARLGTGGPAAARPRLAERTFIAVMLSALLLLWVAVTLAELGALSRLSLLVGVAVPAAGLAWAARRPATGAAALPTTGRATPLDATLVIVVGLVAAGAWLYRPPFEQIVGARDPYTYTLAGIATARDGGFVVEDELVTQIPESAWPDLLGHDYREQRAQYGSRLQGWYLLDPNSGKVVPQGLPLYPAAIAVGYMVGEIGGALRVTAVLAIAGVVSLFFLGLRLYGPAAATTAAILLLVSAPQVWFSRFASAEILAQVLMIAGLYGLFVDRREGSRAHALLSAVAFGLCWQTHIWTVWLVFPLFGILVFDLLRGRVTRRDLAWFWGPLVALGVQALLVAIFLLRAYLYDILLVLMSTLWVLYPLVPALLAGLFACWRLGLRRRRGIAGGIAASGSEPEPRAAASVPTGGAAGTVGGPGHGLRDDPVAPAPVRKLGWARPAIAAAVVALAAYSGWIRPGLTDMELDWSVEYVIRLVLATTPAVFWLAIAGIVLLLLDRRRGEADMLALTVVLATSIPILYDPTISRDLMWALRRYETIYPFVFLFAAAAVWWLPSRVRATRGDGAQRSSGKGEGSAPSWMRGPAGGAAELGWSAAAAVAGALLIAGVAHEGLRYRDVNEPGPAIAMVEEIASSLEDNAVLVFEARSDWGVRDFAPALKFWKGFDVVMLQSKQMAGERALLDFVRRQAQRGRSVYFFTQGFNYYFPTPRLVPHRNWVFRRRVLEPGFGELPRNVLENDVRFATYRLEPGGTNGPLAGGLDVGEWDDIYVGEALSAEVSGPFTARWTKGTGRFWLPGLDAAAGEIVVHADTIGGSGAFNRTLRAQLDGVPLGEITIEQGWTDYVFEVPSDWRPAEGRAPVLELFTEPLQPDAVSGSGDMRYLGIFVNAILWH